MNFREFCTFVALVLFACAVLLVEGWLFRGNATHAFAFLAGGLLARTLAGWPGRWP